MTQGSGALVAVIFKMVFCVVMQVITSVATTIAGGGLAGDDAGPDTQNMDEFGNKSELHVHSRKRCLRILSSGSIG